MEKQTLQIKSDTKDDFEKQRFKLKIKEKRLVTQNEFLQILLNIRKKNNKKIKLSFEDKINLAVKGVC